MRVLVADDSVVTRATLRAILKKLGHEAVSAPDGRTAWKEHCRQHYSVVITDWEMPTMDGLELCRRIRAAPTRDYIYIIVLTHRKGRQSLIGALSAGADDFMPKPCDPEELRARLAVAHRIIGLQSALRDAISRLDRLAHLDPLMAVGNRLAFEDYGPQVHQAAEQSNTSYSVLLCDVDHFKRCNDRFGHSFGDEVLRRLAKVLSDAVRRTDRVFRYGGEEIVIVAPHAQIRETLDVAERLRLRVSEIEFPTGTPEGSLRLTISIGVCCYEPTGTRGTWSQVVDCADHALYKAKHMGRNRVAAATLRDANVFDSPEEVVRQPVRTE
jgi:diguanylate cyclase (GGDEF)-like protein